MRLNLPKAAQKSDFVPFTGGLDVVSPPIMVPAGCVERSFNFYEDINAGYMAVKGYERFSGLPSPSAQGYLILPYTLLGSIVVGVTITGVTSGATGKVIAITDTYLVLTRQTGAFVNENTTAYGAQLTTVGMSSALAGKLGAQYQYLVSQEYRSSITVVPGSGSILGVWYYKGKVYAFRNNAGATAVVMYVSSSSGWQVVNTGYEVYFSAASGAQPNEGATITQGAVSAVIGRLIIESGTFAAGTAIGRFIVSSVTGGTFATGAFTAGVIGTCVIQNTITLPTINGRFEFMTTNFYGQIASSRMYGCDGANRAFEFDGTTFAPLNTGMGPTPINAGGGNCSFATNVMTIATVPALGSFTVGSTIYAAGVTAGTTITAITSGTGGAGSTYTLSTTPGTLAARNTNAAYVFTTTDSPSHISQNQNQLFLSYGSSIMNSALGNPLNWQPLLGAGEIACGDRVTGFRPQPGNTSTAALAILCRNITYILYGTGTGGTSPWQLSLYNDQGGGIDWSIQKINGATYVMDDRGITSLTTAMTYGNFIESTISRPIQTLIASLRYKLTDSHIARDAQQYRLFFSDGRAIYFTLQLNTNAGTSQTISSPMLMQFPDVVRCSCSVEQYGGGQELIYFGSDSGYIFQMEIGTSFDGVAINAFLELVFNSSKAYRTIKHYRHTTFEAVGYGYAEFNASYYLGYNNAGDFAQADNTLFAQDISQTQFWDELTWDNFVWDGVSVSSLSMATPGNGDNIALVITSNSNYFAPIKFSGALIEYTPTRNLR